MTIKQTRIRSRRSGRVAAAAAAAVGLCALTVAIAPVSGDPSPTASKPKVPLKSPAAFAKIKNRAKRSVALFGEAGKVLTHARCINCHPRGDQPGQGDSRQVHQPVVQRGSDGFGHVGLRCTACHQQVNFEPGRVPGAPKWHLAPREMAWAGKSLREICQQIKDPKRNGGRTLQAIVEHMGHDKLVGWAWNPGGDREPAPGDWQTFAALIAAWAETGAQCPTR